jgi:iron complex outermembrane receptor protein
MFYGLYSEGFRLGGNNALRAVEGTGGFITPTYDPDKLKNYELGMKTEWWNKRVLLNATAFFMEWEGFQQNVSGGAWWLNGTINATDKETKGIEANTTILLTDNLTISGSLLWLQGEFTKEFEYLNPDGSVGGVIPKGTESPTQAEWKGNIALDYYLPGAFGTDGMFFHYDWAYQSETWNDLGNAQTRNPNGVIPSWNTSNFRMGVNLENNWTISLAVRNVFDQKAINWLDTGSNYISDHFGAPFRLNVRSYNRPRNIAIQVRKGFY